MDQKGFCGWFVIVGEERRSKFENGKQNGSDHKREREGLQVPEGKERESDPENWLISKEPFFSFFVSLMKNPKVERKREGRMKRKKVDQTWNG